MVVILVVGLTHQSLYCTTDMVRRRLWSSAPGSARYFLALGDGWLDEWVTAVFDCGWVDGERGTKKRLTSNITARLLRRRHFSASYQRETEIPDVCCCSRYSGTKAHTARQVSRAQWNGNQPTTCGKPSLCEWSQQRWIMVQFSLFRTTAPPETFISAPSTKYETANKSYVISRKTTHRVHGHDDGLIPRYWLKHQARHRFYTSVISLNWVILVSRKSIYYFHCCYWNTPHEGGNFQFKTFLHAEFHCSFDIGTLLIRISFEIQWLITRLQSKFPNAIRTGHY